jgi:hypothetical protein
VCLRCFGRVDLGFDPEEVLDIENLIMDWSGTFA